MTKAKISYEEQIKELQKIIEDIQNDKYTLDEIAAAIDRANQIISNCEHSLRNIQDKISKVNEES